MNARILVAALVLVLLPAAVWAHAMLEQASPAAGSTMQGSPAEIRLKFTKEITDATTVTVTGPAGRVDAGKPLFEPYVVRIRLKPMATGTYKVEWHAMSADGHATQGSYTFTVK